MLILSWNLKFFPAFDEPCSGLMVGKGNAIFHTLHVQIENPGIVACPCIWSGLATDAYTFYFPCLQVGAEIHVTEHYIWSFSGGKTILYQGHATGSIPVSNGLSDRISKGLKKRGFKYVGAVTMYSHLQACGIINDHDKDCPCWQKIVNAYPTVNKRRDHEVM
jgi:hypothetical protein